MYCPICFNSSLHIAPSGIALVLINGKTMDTSRIIYHAGAAEKDKLMADISERIEGYFKWYSNFQNKSPIKCIDIVTSEVKCENECIIKAETKFSIIDIIIAKSDLVDLAKKLAQKYHLTLNFEQNETLS